MLTEIKDLRKKMNFFLKGGKIIWAYWLQQLTRKPREPNSRNSFKDTSRLDGRTPDRRPEQAHIVPWSQLVAYELS